MKTLILAAFLALLTACTSTGRMSSQIDTSKPRTVFIEPIPGDGYGLNSKLEMAMLDRGFQPVASAAQASYRLNVAYTFGPTRMTANARLLDTASGATIYSGEAANNGFGTLLSPGAAISGVVESSISSLK